MKKTCLALFTFLLTSTIAFSDIIALYKLVAVDHTTLEVTEPPGFFVANQDSMYNSLQALIDADFVSELELPNYINTEDYTPTGTWDFTTSTFSLNDMTFQGSIIDSLITDSVDLLPSATSSLATGSAIADYVDASVLTQEEIEDYIANLFTGSSHTLISFDYADASNELNASVTPSVDVNTVQTINPDFTDGVITWNATGSTITGSVAANAIQDEMLDFTDITLNDFTFDVGGVDKSEFTYIDGLSENVQDAIDFLRGGGVGSEVVTFENLDGNGDVGTGADQVAVGNHNHNGVYEPVDSNILRAATYSTYYVRADGNDSNDGLTDSAGGAFLTIQRAIDEVQKYKHTSNCTINIGDGTYTENVIITGKQFRSTKLGVIHGLTIQGNETNPENVIISGQVTIDGLGIDLFWLSIENSSGTALVVQNYAYAQLKKVNFGTCLYQHMAVSLKSTINLEDDYTIYGDTARHVWAGSDSIVTFDNITITFSGSRSFSDSFIKDLGRSFYMFNSTVFSGSATGKKYSLGPQSYLQIIGYSDTSFLPGDVAGESWGDAKIVDYNNKVDLSPVIPVERRTALHDTYYVRADGNDSNDGLTDSAGGAFLTIQRAIDELYKYIHDDNCFIYVGDGTYTENVTVDSGDWIGQNRLNIIGNNVTPSNVVVNGNSIHFYVTGSIYVIIKDLKVTGGITGIVAEAGALCRVEGVDFGSFSGAHMSANRFSALNLKEDYVVSGDAPIHISLLNYSVADFNTINVTFSGTRNFSNAVFLSEVRSSTFNISSSTFTGTSTGVKYKLGSNSILNGDATSLASLPGDTTGIIYGGAKVVDLTNAKQIPNFFTVWNFSVSGTWTKPDNLAYIKVKVWGAGGGGGGVYNPATSSINWLAAGGGASGGYSEALILAENLGATETVTIGAVGAGGLATGTDGSTGGYSAFGAHCRANGGFGGKGQNANSWGACLGGARANVADCVGDLVFRGIPGQAGWSYQNAGMFSGAGAGAGAGAGRITAGAGEAGTHGAGGGGAAVTSNTGYAGGNGGPGYISVEMYYK